MKKTDLLEALGDVSEKYLNEAQERAVKAEGSCEFENIVMGVDVMRKYHIRKNIIITITAASLILVFGTVSYMVKKNGFGVETPPEVLKEIEILDNQNSYSSSETLTLTYDTLPNILASINAVMENNQGTIQILGEPSVPDCMSMPVYDISAYIANNAECETLFHKLLPTLNNEGLNAIQEQAAFYDLSEKWQKVTQATDSGGVVVDISQYGWNKIAKGFRLMNEEGTALLAVTSDGLICNYFQDIGESPIYYTNSQISDIIPVSYETIDDQLGYPMLNGEIWYLSDAIKFAENYYNTAFSDISGNYTYRVSEVIVRSLSVGGYGYDFTLQRILPDGNTVLPLSYLNYDLEQDDYSSVLIGSSSSMWCVLPNQVQEFSCDSIYQMTEKEDQELLTAASAIQIVENALAQKQMHSVYMELGYLYRVNDSVLLSITKSEHDIDAAIENADYSSAQAIPFWIFYEPLEDAKPRTSGTYYLVNALTGELEIR